MATIEGVIRPGGPLEPCVWCEEPTDTRGQAPGLGPNVELPIHVFCAGAVIVAYRWMQNGRLTVDQAKKLERYGRALAALPAGSLLSEEKESS